MPDLRDHLAFWLVFPVLYGLALWAWVVWVR